jgi:hypothetical protein
MICFSERMSSYIFLFKQNSSQARKHLTPVRWMQHSSLFLGERTMKNNMAGMPQESGYQAMRLATELFPATFAMIGAKNISPFWSVLFYFVLIMFGIGQQVSRTRPGQPQYLAPRVLVYMFLNFPLQIAIWHCVVSGIISLHPFKLRKWRTTITFLSCAAAFSIGLFMATEVSNSGHTSQTFVTVNIIIIGSPVSAGDFRRLPHGLLRRLWLVDDGALFAGDRSSVHGPRSSVQRRDCSGHVVFASQSSPAGVAGAHAVI